LITIYVALCSNYSSWKTACEFLSTTIIIRNCSCVIPYVSASCKHKFSITI